MDDLENLTCIVYDSNKCIFKIHEYLVFRTVLCGGNVLSFSLPTHKNHNLFQFYYI